MTFTVETRNEVTGRSRFVGTFPTRDRADAYVDQEARRSRSFATFQVWSGTPRGPIKALGPVVRGVALEENPVGAGWVVAGIAAAGALVWALWPKKKAEESPTPPIAPTTPRDASTPPPINFLPVTIVGCTLNQANWESWIAQANRFGPWLTQAGVPPKPSELKALYPNLANVPNERLAAATDNGASVWLYGAWDTPPVKRDDARKNICDWVADPKTPILGT